MAEKPKISSAQPGPGGLRTQARLTIHTRQAQALYSGRQRVEGGKAGIVGLEGFARAVARIAAASAGDDPYADLALLQVEEALDRATKAVRADISATTKELEAIPDAIDIDLTASVEPIQLPLMLGSPYISLGAYLLHDFDELMRTIMTLQRAAVLDREHAYALLLRTGRPVRRVYGLPLLRWRATGVTRDAVRENARIAQQARVVYDHLKVGEIPADVLQGTRRPRYAPPIRRGGEKNPASYLDEEDE